MYSSNHGRGDAGPKLQRDPFLRACSLRLQLGRSWHLHAPLEDGEGAAGGEGAVGVLEAQHALRVQRLVDVGVRLELVPLVRTRLNHHPHPRMRLV